MDHTHSELPPGDPTSEALLLVIDALRLAIKDNPQLREALAQFLAKLIPDPAEQTPREAISKVVDNSPPESMGIDQSIPNDMHDSNPDESGCSASTRLQGGDAY